MWRYAFADDDCRAAGTCVCGMCKRHTADGTRADCDWGDCRRTPVPGDRDCEKHRESREYIRSGYWDPWAPVGLRAMRPSPAVSSQEEKQEGETDGGA